MRDCLEKGAGMRSQDPLWRDPVFKCTGTRAVMITFKVLEQRQNRARPDLIDQWTVWSVMKL